MKFGIRLAGLTLSETLVALSLLSLLLVAALNIFPTSMMIVRSTRTEWLARSAAQNRLETLAAEPFQQLTLIDEGTAAWERVTLDDGAVVELRTTISQVDEQPITTLKRLRVEARWQGRAREKSLSQELYVHALRR